MKKRRFSWRRFLGISQFKSKISRTIGIPLTKSGRQKKLKRLKSKVYSTFLILVILIALVMSFYK